MGEEDEDLTKNLVRKKSANEAKKQSAKPRSRKSGGARRAVVDSGVDTEEAKDDSVEFEPGFFEAEEPIVGEGSPKVMLGLPWLKSVHPSVAFWLMALVKKKGESLVIVPKFGDSMVYHARNKLALRFLESDCEYLLMIDDDMLVPVGVPALHRTLLRLPENYPYHTLEGNIVDDLVSQKKDIVGATYWKRSENGPPMFAEGLTNQHVRKLAADGVKQLYRTKWVATGAIMIHRSVFERIRDHYGDTLNQPVECGTYGWFYPDLAGGEDTAFCRRAIAAGCEAYVHLGCHAQHLGYKVFGAHTGLDR